MCMTATGSTSNTPDASVSFTFPVIAYAAPYVWAYPGWALNGSGAGVGAYRIERSTTETFVQFRYLDDIARTASVNINLLAIGRWKA